MFGFIFLIHILRVLNGWNAQVENFVVPMWFSWIALISMGYLSFEAFKHWKSS